MATPSYKDGKIFFAPGDNERRVFALNNSGSIFWVSNQLNTSGEGLIPSSIAIDEENLYLVYTTTKEWIAALKQNNGNILWQIDLGEKQASNYIASPSVLNGSIFIPTQSGYLFEISTSGVINNSFLVNTSSSPVYTTPAISNGKLYLATWSGIVKCYQAEEVVSISYPDKDTVSGLVGIKGYIKSSSSLNWTIYYSTDNLNFTEISTGTSQVNGTVIVDWDTNLLSDGTYYLKISANNGDAYNRCILDNPPSPPQNLTAIDNPSDDGGAILLSWSKSLDDGTGSDDVQGYKIYRSTLPFTLYTLHLTLLKGTTYYKDSGLTDYLTYYYYIKSYDSLSDSSKSETVFAYPYDDLSPLPPTNFYIIAGDGLIDLYWSSSPSSDVNFYDIYKSTDNNYFVSLITVSYNGSHYRDGNLVNHTTYYYYIISVDNAGNRSFPTQTKSVFPYEGADTESPSIITTLYSVSNKESEVKLYWLAPGDDGTIGKVEEGRWKIEGSTLTGFSNISYTLAVSTSYSFGEKQTFSITNLTPLTTYYFRIYAYDNANRYSVSNISTITVYGKSPASITDLAAVTGTTEGGIDLFWTSPGDDGTVGKVEAGRWEIEGSTESSFYVLSYELEISTSYTPLEKHSLMVTGLIKGVTYYFRIFAFDDWNLKSETSNIASALSLPDATIPKDVTNFSVSDTENDFGGSLTLTWSKSPDDGAGENDVKNYYIYRSTIPDFSNITIITLNAGTTYYIDTGLTDGINYYYMIKSFDGWNFSDGVKDSASSVSNWKGVSTEGGTSDLGNGVEVEIPEGAYTEKLYFFVRVPEVSEYNNIVIPENVSGTDIVREVILIKESEKNLLSGKNIDYIRNYTKSREITLLKNITLKISYQGGSFTNEERLRLFYLDEGDNIWKMIHTSYPDLSNDKVIAEVPHFSYFRIMEFLGTPYLIDKNRCYVYPQPAKGDEIYFKFYLGNVCKVKIKVFNVNGDLIKLIEKEFSLLDIGKAQKIKWDISSVASGVYIWILEAEGSGKKETIKKKLGIVH